MLSVLTSVETMAAENIEALAKAEAEISQLKSANATLLERLDDLENRSCRTNLQIVRVRENSKTDTDMIAFTANLIKEMMCNQVFMLAHRALAAKLKDGKPPRTIVVCFHRRHELQYWGKNLRLYADLSTQLYKARLAFNDIKATIYQKGIHFRHLYPMQLQITHKGNNLIFETPSFL